MGTPKTEPQECNTNFVEVHKYARRWHIPMIFPVYSWGSLFVFPHPLGFSLGLV